MSLVKLCHQLAIDPRRIVFIEDDEVQGDVRVAIRARGLRFTRFRGAAAQSLRDFISRLPPTGPGPETEDQDSLSGSFVHGSSFASRESDGGSESAVRQQGS